MYSFFSESWYKSTEISPDFIKPLLRPHIPFLLHFFFSSESLYSRNSRKSYSYLVSQILFSYSVFHPLYFSLSLFLTLTFFLIEIYIYIWIFPKPTGNHHSDFSYPYLFCLFWISWNNKVCVQLFLAQHKTFEIHPIVACINNPFFFVTAEY